VAAPPLALALPPLLLRPQPLRLHVAHFLEQLLLLLILMPAPGLMAWERAGSYRGGHCGGVAYGVDLSWSVVMSSTGRHLLVRIPSLQLPVSDRMKASVLPYQLPHPYNLCPRPDQFPTCPYSRLSYLGYLQQQRGWLPKSLPAGYARVLHFDDDVCGKKRI
jgi:hypothetical protein